MQKIDLTGQRFGRLTVIREAKSAQFTSVRWLCQCDCGNEAIIRGACLRSGHTQSCGCMKSEVTAARNYKHGESASRLHSVWSGILARTVYCKETDGRIWRDYGSRGITICNEWRDYSTFSKWAHENGYNDNLTIDRIDNDKGYSPDNCRWVTVKDQANNKRSNVLVDWHGEEKTLSQWSEQTGLNYHTLSDRYHRGLRGDFLFQPVIEKTIPVIAIAPDGSELYFSSMKEAAEKTGANRTDIGNICHGRRGYRAGGYAWRFAEVIA